MDDADIRNLVKEWHSRSRRETDPISKFVFLWFCFNAWLTFESDEERDRQMIDWLKGASASISKLCSAYEVAEGSDYFREPIRALAGMCPIASSRPGPPDVVITSVHDFPNVVEAVYRVRCNLFHGSKRASQARDLKLIKVCAQILEKWVGNLVADLGRQ